jgi:hypothetical protein
MYQAYIRNEAGELAKEIPAIFLPGWVWNQKEKSDRGARCCPLLCGATVSKRNSLLSPETIVSQ